MGRERKSDFGNTLLKYLPNFCAEGGRGERKIKLNCDNVIVEIKERGKKKFNYGSLIAEMEKWRKKKKKLNCDN